jgi:SpoVK/Ycf46/Vps4 family AAA+-type ATPase
MTGIVESIPTYLKSLWDVEAELRRAAQNALFLRNAEASQHLEQARRHFSDALKAINPAEEVNGTPPKPSSASHPPD